MRQKFSVPYSYEVVFTRRLFDPANRALARVLKGRGGRGLVFIDAGLARRWPGLKGRISRWCARHPGALELAGEPETVCGGEAAKNHFFVVQRVIRRIREAGLCRHSYVVAIGGGAVLDAVGFAAAVAHRGLRLIRVPTTVLAQNDSGVGVKCGINLAGDKNFVGSFAPPFAVLNDSAFLTTLAGRDWRAGIAEAFKVALIRDRRFFLFLERRAQALARRDLPAMERLVRRCAALHLAHISAGGDPFETGSARPLDFGHWAGHKLESLSGWRLRHGEAVAVGIALDLVIAQRLGLVAARERDRALAALAACGLPTWDALLAERLPGGRLAVLEGLEEFRRHLGGRLTLTMPRGLGRGVEIHRLPEALVEEAAAWLAARAGAARRRRGAARAG